MGMQMERACTIAVYVHVCIICTWRHIAVRYVHAIDMYGAATGMQIMRSGLGLGLEEVFVFDSESENRDRAVAAAVSVSEARAV